MQSDKKNKKNKITEGEGIKKCGRTYQFAEWEFPFHATAGIGALRCRRWTLDPLQRAPGQPAVSSKRDRNNLLRFARNIEARGVDGGPCAALAAERRQLGDLPRTV